MLLLGQYHVSATAATSRTAVAMNTPSHSRPAANQRLTRPGCPGAVRRRVTEGAPGATAGVAFPARWLEFSASEEFSVASLRTAEIDSTSVLTSLTCW